MTMENAELEESIPIVTIHSPSDVSSSPTFLLRSTSLVHLNLNESPIEQTHGQPNDSTAISKNFSMSTNAVNQANPFPSSNPNFARRHLQSEINLSQNKCPNDANYDQLNSRLIGALGFDSLPNHTGDPSKLTPPLAASLTSSPVGGADKSLWGRLKSTLCRPSRSAYRHRLDRLLYYLRVFLTHLFSTTGLCFLVAAYAGLGAVIFTRLESGHENTVKASLEAERIRTANELWNFTLKLNVFHEKRWLKKAIQHIGQFEEKVVQTMLTKGYGATVEQWSFSGALLYSVTVITTIGYGNVTCKTDWGRIATIFYAIIGIPITFLCLANLGNLMAKAFRFSYRKICCCECFCPSKATKLRKRASMRSASQKRRNKKDLSEADTIGPNAATFLVPPPPTPPTGTSLATTAFFDNASSSNGTSSLAPVSSGGRHHSVLVVTQPGGDGLPKLGAVDLQRSHSLYNRSTSQGPPSPALTVVTVKSGNSTKTELAPKAAQYIDNESDVDDLDQEELDALEDEERVPIYLVFLLVLGYIILGAFMFSIWERWGPIEGAYFCFTTLTTIGFGDLVPGAARFAHDNDGQTKFIICCAYLMVGLALIAMSFNLVQEEIVIKCRRIARRLGIMPTDQEQKKFAAENRRRFKALWSKSDQEKADIL